MASYKGVQGVLTALEAFFKSRLPSELSDGPTKGELPTATGEKGLVECVHIPVPALRFVRGWPG